MSEWWTYTLSDFLLFSDRTYYRLFEIYNAAIWPAQIAILALGLAILALWGCPRAASGRIAAGILAACWLWVAIAFHARHYATINWAAAYFAWAFGAEAALLLWIGVIRGALSFERPAGAAARAGIGIFAFALLFQPLAGPLLGRSWKGIELFGAAPDPTAVATLGILLAANLRRRWLPMVVPVLWCAITGLTLFAMKTPDFWITPLAAALAVALAAAARRPVTSRSTSSAY